MKHSQNHACCDLITYLNDFLDDTLDPEIKKAFEKHLENCENCRVIVNTTTKTIQLCKANSENISLPPKLLERLKNNLGLDEE